MLEGVDFVPPLQPRRSNFVFNKNAKRNPGIY
jgi:hypothetical protein